MPGFGERIRRLRKAGKLSLGELSQQSGVAKSIISQLEKNRTNPTLQTLWRLSRGLNLPLEEVIRCDARPTIIEKVGCREVPTLVSEDGLCRLVAAGWLQCIEWVQWYDLRAEPGGVLESAPHSAGCVENISVLQGRLRVDAGEQSEVVEAGQTLRFYADRRHAVTNIGTRKAHAIMVNLLKPQHWLTDRGV